MREPQSEYSITFEEASEGRTSLRVNFVGFLRSAINYFAALVVIWEGIEG